LRSAVAGLTAYKKAFEAELKTSTADFTQGQAEVYGLATGELHLGIDAAQAACSEAKRFPL
jgi:hypothetical protein